MANLSQKKKLLKLLGKLSPEGTDPTILEGVFNEVEKIKESIPKPSEPTNLSPLYQSIQDILTKLNSQEELTKNEKAKIEQSIKDLQKEIEKNTSQKLDALKVELSQQIQSRGGGAMNRRMMLAGVDVLKSYTDVNFIGSITAANNNAKKWVDFTFTSGGTPGGSDTNLQYNSSGSFAGFGYTDGTNEALGTVGEVVVNGNFISSASWSFLGGWSYDSGNQAAKFTSAGTPSDLAQTFGSLQPNGIYHYSVRVFNRTGTGTGNLILTLKDNLGATIVTKNLSVTNGTYNGFIVFSSIQQLRYVYLTAQTLTGTVTFNVSSVSLGLVTLTGNMSAKDYTGSTLNLSGLTWDGANLLSLASGKLLLTSTLPSGALSSTDAAYSFGTGSLPSGMFTEVNGTILSYGINVEQIGTRDNSRPGYIFREDTRDGGGFIIYGYPPGGNTPTQLLKLEVDGVNGYVPNTIYALRDSSNFDINQIASGYKTRLYGHSGVQFRTSGADPAVTITTAGLLGVGTDTPLMNLQLVDKGGIDVNAGDGVDVWGNGYYDGAEKFLGSSGYAEKIHMSQAYPTISFFFSNGASGGVGSGITWGAGGGASFIFTDGQLDAKNADFVNGNNFNGNYANIVNYVTVGGGSATIINGTSITLNTDFTIDMGTNYPDTYFNNAVSGNAVFTGFTGIFLNLPTSPGATGSLWNSLGFVKVA